MAFGWGTTITTQCIVALCVKQGRLISHNLFNMYMDNLRTAFQSNSCIEEYLEDDAYQLCHADDPCLLSLSFSGCSNC